jgi:hypothetical protein
VMTNNAFDFVALAPFLAPRVRALTRAHPLMSSGMIACMMKHCHLDGVTRRTFSNISVNNFP